MEAPRYLSEIIPHEDASLSWVPDRMDPNSSYRIAVRVGAYVKINDDGSREYCEACNIAKVLDRDCTNWNDMLLDIDTYINLGCNNKLRVTYWDKSSHNYEEVTSDQKLLHAIDMYWEIRSLSLQVCVIKKDDYESMYDTGREQSMPCVLQGSTDAPTNEISVLPPLETASPLLEPPDKNNTEVAWVDDDVEYVGLDDEDPFKTLLSDSSDSECDGDVECVGLEDDLVVEDAWGCEFGHMAKTCNEYVYDSNAPPPAPPKPKRKRGKKVVTIVPSSVAEPPQEQPSYADPVAIACSTPTRAITCAPTTSPVTRSMLRRLLELYESKT